MVGEKTSTWRFEVAQAFERWGGLNVCWDLDCCGGLVKGLESIEGIGNWIKWSPFRWVAIWQASLKVGHWPRLSDFGWDWHGLQVKLTACLKSVSHTPTDRSPVCVEREAMRGPNMQVVSTLPKAFGPEQGWPGVYHCYQVVEGWCRGPTFCTQWIWMYPVCTKQINLHTGMVSIVPPLLSLLELEAYLQK